MDWCRAHSADRLDEKRRQWGVVGQAVCVLGVVVSGMVCVLAELLAAGPRWPPVGTVSLADVDPRRACPQKRAENSTQEGPRPRWQTMIRNKCRPLRAPRIRIVAERSRPG